MGSHNPTRALNTQSGAAAASNTGHSPHLCGKRPAHSNVFHPYIYSLRGDNTPGRRVENSARAAKASGTRAQAVECSL